ncbi:RNA 2'-phosphotransferase [Acaryochloris thomasi RCC1774]|uniref:Probable RNA 2'-phosphotransferase n=2 Tax=Acaryochloris TaxID=155977 RepID=A0A2W1JLY0_9CYAN|nr:RNA 2'-phosphotransferase [Acaryochloris thomasi RCC1774]
MMDMRKQLVLTSKFLSLVLRHKPETIGLTLDEHGWIEIAALLEAAQRHKRPISREKLDEVVFTNDKQRFAFSPDGLKIRANQGHSVAVDVELQSASPPQFLFHGTVARFFEAIQAVGLSKMQRQHVHLSASQDAALRVGARRGQPLLLQVAAGKMHNEGYIFFQSRNGVWLTDSVPWRYIEKLDSVSSMSRS